MDEPVSVLSEKPPGWYLKSLSGADPLKQRPRNVCQARAQARQTPHYAAEIHLRFRTERPRQFSTKENPWAFSFESKRHPQRCPSRFNPKEEKVKKDCVLVRVFPNSQMLRLLWIEHSASRWHFWSWLQSGALPSELKPLEVCDLMKSVAPSLIIIQSTNGLAHFHHASVSLPQPSEVNWSHRWRWIELELDSWPFGGNSSKESAFGVWSKNCPRCMGQ